MGVIEEVRDQHTFWYGEYFEGQTCSRVIDGHLKQGDGDHEVMIL